MMLIDADALKEEFDGYIKANPNIIGIFEVGKIIIDNAPTVEVLNPEQIINIVPHECIEILAKTVIDVIQQIDWKTITEELSKRPRGEWISHIRSIECSVCKYEFFADDENENCQDYEPCADFNFNFCPNCGADMRKEAKNDTTGI